MIEIVHDEAATTQATQSKKVLRMVKHERTAGSMPVWESASTPKQKVEESLSLATSQKANSFENALALQQPQDIPSETDTDEFGFGDIVDMVNPLHHIPIIGQVYRHLTGDEIRPISKIIGGSIYGGPVGGASSLINVIIEEETGKDLAGNAFAMVARGEKPSFKTVPDEPEKRLGNTIQRIENGEALDLPGSILSFTDLGGGRRMITEKIAIAGGRTAGSMIRKHIEIIETLPAMRQPITQVMLSPPSAIALLNKEQTN